MMFITKQLQEFLNRSDIQAVLKYNKFDTIYNLWKDQGSVRELTTFLFSCDIDPFNYMTTIPSSAFAGNESLVTYSIPDSISDIEYLAFGDCTNLSKVTVGSQVKHIQSDAFKGCTNISEVHITDLANWCSIKFHSFLANPVTTSENLYLNDVLLTDIIIPNTILAIEPKVFENCKCLTKVKVPGCVKTIGWRAFRQCDNLNTLIIEKGLRQINSEAFCLCYNLHKIIFQGTKEEWKAVIRAPGWDGYTGGYIIHCTDGDIRKGEQ